MKKLVVMLFLICMGIGLTQAKTETNYRNALILAYSPVNSVYEDENIKLEIYNEMLYATNLTKKTIFIDLSQCFLVNNGSSYPIWSKKTDEKKASRAGVSSSDDEFITIAPATGGKQNPTYITNMSDGIYGKYTSSEGPSGDFSDYDKRLRNIIGEMVEESISQDPKGKAYIGTVVKHLEEDESISNIGASIAYAFNKRAEDWTTISISTWVCDIIFAPYYVEMPKDLTQKEKQGFGVKESTPAKVHVKASTPFEFEEDKSPVIVCDWEGDFKKGTFNLARTKISKQKKMNPLAAGLLTIATGGVAAGLVRTPISETFYKSIINFDGEDADWGKLTYAPEVLKTKQTK